MVVVVVGGGLTMHEHWMKNDTVQLLPSELFLQIKWSFAAVKQIPPDKMGPLNKKKKKKVVAENGCFKGGAETSPGGLLLLLAGFNVMFIDSMCPPLCLCLASQEHHEGRYCQQQHGQHLASQESRWAAEDGGLHGQDKGRAARLFFFPLAASMSEHVHHCLVAVGEICSDALNCECLEHCYHKVSHTRQLSANILFILRPSKERNHNIHILFSQPNEMEIIIY